MDSEDTVYSKAPDSGIILDYPGEKGANSVASPQTAPGKKNSSHVKQALTGLGAGVLLGGTAAFAASAFTSDGVEVAADKPLEEGGKELPPIASVGGEAPVAENGDEPVPHEGGGETVPHPAWTDGQVDIATGVNDDMSFAEAFAAARGEVGNGGAFEWRGNVYGTFTQEEWSEMPASERAAFNDHFEWNHYESDYDSADESDYDSADESHYASADAGADASLDASAEVSEKEAAESGSFAETDVEVSLEEGDEADSEVIPETGDDVEVTVDDALEEMDFGKPGDAGDVEVSLADVEAAYAEGNGEDEEIFLSDDDVVAEVDQLGEEAADDDSEVEVLGVVHDDESNMNIGQMMVDGEEVAFVDVDGDGNFDYVAVDADNDGEYSAEEIDDISDEDINVSDFEALADSGDGDVYEGGDELNMMDGYDA